MVKAKKEQLREAAGDSQYGVGRKSGAQLLKKRLEAEVELRPATAVLKVDLKAAFQNMLRDKAYAAVTACEAEVASVLQTWYEGESTHLWRDIGGHYHEIGSTRGFDQGCPLAAAAFAIGQRSVLDPFLQQLLLIDPHAKLFSYLDDTYLVVAKEVAARTLAALEQAFQPLGLTLNPTKTQL